MKNNQTYHYDVVIVGGGTAGVAAAYALKDSGKKVLLIEQRERLGGTAVLGYVHNWITGVFPKYLEEVFTVLKTKGRAQGDLANSWLPAYFRKDGKDFGLENAIQMAPFDLSEKYFADLKDSIEIWRDHSFVDIQKMDAGKVSQIKVRDNNNIEKIVKAKFFIDSSADAVLCCDKGELSKDFFVGRDKFLGTSECGLYNEDLLKDADPNDPNQINEPSLFFFLTEAGNDEAILKRQKDVALEIKERWDGNINSMILENKAGVLRDGFIIPWFDEKGKYICNSMTGTGITGMDLINKGGAQAIYSAFYQKTLEFWKFIKLRLTLEYYQNNKNDETLWGAWKIWQRKLNIDYIAPMIGVRETYRVSCEYMLRQEDLTKHINFEDWEDYIAIGVYGVDMHNQTGMEPSSWKNIDNFNKKCVRPYGVPYKCLLPKRFTNVLIACRAFGASQIAASAFRMNKAMAQLGWAAGNAVKYCLENRGKTLKGITGKDIQGSGYIDFKYYVDNIKDIVRTEWN